VRDTLGQFAGGESGNPNGRPKGARNKRTQEILDLIQQRGDKDPLDFLSEVISSTNHYSDELKVQAANYLTPYLHSKRSVAAPAPRYIDSPVQVPAFQSVDEAENFLATLPVLLGKGELDSQTALELSTLTRAWISARHEREELQLKLADHGGGAEQHIIIEGGLPALPGTNVIMPHLNGIQGQTTDYERNPHVGADIRDRGSVAQSPQDVKCLVASCPSRHPSGQGS
jgi:Family of unknown function (DUF5681)